MKITTECVHCLLKRIIFEATESTRDTALHTKVITETCKLLSELYSPEKVSAELATKAHKQAYELLGDSDPYKTLKQQSNSIAQSLIPKVEKLIKTSENPLKTSMICAIIGNMMDFGIAGGSDRPDKLTEVFDDQIKKGLGYDDYHQLEPLIKQVDHILLFTDNCGEIVFDKLLCRELKQVNPDLHLTLVVRGEPVISDATYEDAEQLHFSEVVDDILTTGCFAVGVDFSRLPSDLAAALENCDLILCKGMANFESFSETSYRPIAYLLRTKCMPIARAMNIPINVNAIKLYT